MTYLHMNCPAVFTDVPGGGAVGVRGRGGRRVDPYQYITIFGDKSSRYVGV